MTAMTILPTSMTATPNIDIAVAMANPAGMFGSEPEAGLIVDL